MFLRPASYESQLGDAHVGNWRRYDCVPCSCLATSVTSSEGVTTGPS